jgi:hypothetical protein
MLRRCTHLKAPHRTFMTRLLALLGTATAVRAQSLPVSEPPAPLRTRDLTVWVDQIKPDERTRAVMEQSFDACVERWIEVRDPIVRPAQARVDAESAATIAEATGIPDLARPTMRLEFGGADGDSDIEELAMGGGGMMVFSSAGEVGDLPMGKTPW